MVEVKNGDYKKNQAQKIKGYSKDVSYISDDY